MAAYLFGLALVSSYASYASSILKPLRFRCSASCTRVTGPVSSDGSHGPLKMQSSPQFGRGTDGHKEVVPSKHCLLRSHRNI